MALEQIWSFDTSKAPLVESKHDIVIFFPTNKLFYLAWLCNAILNG